MKHSNNYGNTAKVHNTSHKDRNTPSYDCDMPIGEWQADVVAMRDGIKTKSIRRKVKTNGVVCLDAVELLDDAIDYLRSGYEVRLCESTGEAIRLFPCLDRNFSQMFVAAMTMGKFRDSVSDIKFHVKHCGVALSNKAAQRWAEEHDEEFEKNKLSVTPDTMVTCPKCGTEFRVGHQLAK